MAPNVPTRAARVRADFGGNAKAGAATPGRTSLTSALCFVLGGTIAMPLPAGTQPASAQGLRRDGQQTPAARAGWPCGARLDPSYFQVTEGSGGHLLLLAPAEIGDAASLLAAFDGHRQTIFRLAGSINPGVHEFRVPIDSTVDSVVFSISVQCLQAASVARPSGAPLTGGDGVTDLSNFQAERMLIVQRPEPGVWTIRAAGNGVAGVMVQARSALAIADLQFAAAGTTAFTRVPSAGVENVVKIALGGPAADVTASIVNAASRRLAPLELTAGDTEGSYVGRFTPGAQGFRVMIEGKTTDGVPFQRVHAPLFTVAR